MPSSASIDPRPPTSPLFPYTTLFRSRHRPRGPRRQCGDRARRGYLLSRRLCRSTGPKHWHPAPFVWPVGATTARRRTSSPVPCRPIPDRKSTRLNSSHVKISYAVFCLDRPAPPHIPPLSLHDALPISTPTTRTAAPVWRPSTARIPAEPQVVPLNRAEALASRAVRLARRGDYRAATHEFARALQADP